MERGSGIAALAALGARFHAQIMVASHDVVLQETLGRMHDLIARYGSLDVRQPASQELTTASTPT